MDREQVRKAIDSFEDEEYYDSEETLSKELKKAKNDYFKKTLDLEDDVEDVETDDSTDNDSDNNDPDNDNFDNNSDPDNNDDS